jgi:multiple sugar transport system substrate-binding protein
MGHGIYGGSGRQTRRHTIAAGATLSAAGGLFAVACGTSSAPADSVGGTGGAPKLKAGSTLVFWNDQGGGMTAVMQDWGKRFEQKHGVKVEVTSGLAGDFASKLTASFTAGTPPDVYRYLQENVPIVAAVDRNFLLKLDSFIKRDKFDLTDFRKDAVELYKWKGSTYALPRAYGLQCIFYNTDIFAREGLPPIPGDWNDKTWTYDKFVGAAQTLGRGGDRGERYAMFVPRASRLWASFIYSNGGAIVKKNADGLATEFAIQEQQAVDALQLMQDLIYKHRVAPQPSEEAALGNQLSLMQSGKLAMQITNPGGNANLRASGMPYDVGVFPLGNRASRRGTGGGGTGWGVSGPTKQQEEAWAFLSFIASKEAQVDELKEGSTTPVRISLSTSAEYISPPPKNARVFADGQEYVVRDPVHTRWPDVERDVVNKLLNEQLWTGKSPAAQVTKQIKEQGDPFFK